MISNYCNFFSHAVNGTKFEQLIQYKKFGSRLTQDVNTTSK